jgi:hypothetical protein
VGAGVRRSYSSPTGVTRAAFSNDHRIDARATCHGFKKTAAPAVRVKDVRRLPLVDACYNRTWHLPLLAPP